MCVAQCCCRDPAKVVDVGAPRVGRLYADVGPAGASSNPASPQLDSVASSRGLWVRRKLGRGVEATEALYPAGEHVSVVHCTTQRALVPGCPPRPSGVEGAGGDWELAGPATLLCRAACGAVSTPAMKCAGAAGLTELCH